MTVSETVISDAKIRIISESTKEMGRKTAGATPTAWHRP